MKAFTKHAYYISVRLHIISGTTPTGDGNYPNGLSFLIPKLMTFAKFSQRMIEGIHKISILNIRRLFIISGSTPTGDRSYPQLPPQCFNFTKSEAYDFRQVFATDD